MPRARPALVLLAALVGGLGASSVHLAHHGLEREASRAAHAADGAHDADADLLTPPCPGAEVHEAPCAVCSGFAGAELDQVAGVAAPPAPERETAAVEAHAAHRRAVAPARGPPPSVA